MSRKGENIYKRKDGRWEGRFKKGTASNGKTIYGSCYGKTYREVKEKLEKHRQSASAGIMKKPNFEKNFSEYCNEWLLLKQSKVKESTLVKYAATLEKHIKPYFGSCYPKAITTELTAAFVNHIISKKELSSKSAKDIAVILKSILQYIAQNSAQFNMIVVAMPKYTAKEIRVLSFEEQQRLIAFLLKDMNDCKFGVLFALTTGLRIGEVCALRTGDISLKEKTVTVRETMQRIKNTGDGAKTKIILTAPKSDTSSRVVPLTNTAFELCRERVSQNSEKSFLLTGSESKYIEPRTLQYHIKRYSEACGIENMHFHVLRHTFATRCVEVGFEIKSLSEVLGHSSPRITLERYVHSSLDFKRQNMTKLEAIGL